MLAAVLEQMPVGVIVAEAPAGTVILDNTTGDSGRGTRSTGETVFDYYHREPFFHADGTAYDMDEWPLVRSLANGEIVEGEALEVGDESGGRRTMEVSSAPIRDRSGDIVAGVSTLVDVTGLCIYFLIALIILEAHRSKRQAED